MTKCSRLMLVFVVLCLAPFVALAQVLLESDTGRTEGFFTKSPVYQRAVMWPAAEKSDTAVLFYPGWPGKMWLESNSTHYPPGFNTPINPNTFQTTNISLVMMDCPTDELGPKSYDRPQLCDDTYRSSARHAEDARLIIKKMKTEFNITKIYLIGHSHGTISAKILGRELADEISGVISSGASSRQYGNGDYKNFGWAGARFNMKSLKVPVLNIHHEKDGCMYNPFSTVQNYSTNNLITVRGGMQTGDPCKKDSYHSYQGYSSDTISMAIINWIKTREVQQFIGE